MGATDPFLVTIKISMIVNRLVAAKGRGMDEEFGISRCKSLHINKKVLLQSVEDCTQHPETSHHGENMENNAQMLYMYD